MALANHCRVGDLATLQAYCAQAAVTATQVRNARALSLVCERGYLEIARWLQRTFQLTAADVRAEDNCALRGACANGHLEVARWLQRTFQLTAEDARAVNNYAFRTACTNGYLEVARWLQQTFQLTAADARADDNWALWWACAYGHLEIARWMQRTFQLTAVDVRTGYNVALQRACERGHLDVLRWLQRTWGIPPVALAAVASGPMPAPCSAYLRGLRALCWSPRTHADFPLPSRRLALLLLLVYQRLACEPGPLPPLPPELWHHLLSYLPAWQ